MTSKNITKVDAKVHFANFGHVDKARDADLLREFRSTVQQKACFLAGNERQSKVYLDGEMREKEYFSELLKVIDENREFLLD